MTGSISKNGLGLFYAVSSEAIRHVADHSDRAALVLAYLALKRHQQKHRTHVISAGAPTLQKAFDISYPRARKLLKDLQSIAWGPAFYNCAVVDAKIWNQQCMDGEEIPLGSYQANKVMPACGEDYIYLPNMLNTCGPGQSHSPLGQLYRLPDKTIRLDAVMLLLGLYEHLDMQHCGGVDPSTAIYIPWRTEGMAHNDDFLELGYQGAANGLHYQVVDMRSSDNAYWKEHLLTSQWSFIESVTSETSETEAPRFWTAWRALRDLGLADHVAMVFDADPLLDPDAEILYPLWTFNKAERQRLNDRNPGEGGLAHLVSNRTQRDAELDELNGSLIEAYSEQFLFDEPTGFFIAASPTPDAKVIGILRPRFIPNTKDSQRGWAELRDKAVKWKKKLEADK